MPRFKFIVVGCIALACATSNAHAEGGYSQPDEMIRRSKFIAIVIIDGITSLPKTQDPIWTFGQRAHATVERNIKGVLPHAIDICGGENFVCQHTELAAGRYLAFLCHYPKGELTSANYQMGIRPMRGDRVEWYYDNGRGSLSPNFGYNFRWQRLDSLLHHITVLQGSNRSLQPTAGRSDASLRFMKHRLLQSTLALASGG
jgi:hypothetical protein